MLDFFWGDRASSGFALAIQALTLNCGTQKSFDPIGEERARSERIFFCFVEDRQIFWDP
jgi:hypothetical protein